MFTPAIPPKKKTVCMTIIIPLYIKCHRYLQEFMNPPKAIHGSPCEKALDLRDGFTLRVAKSFRKRKRESAHAMMRVPFPFR